MRLAELIDFNPRMALPKTAVVPFIDMAALPTMGRDISLVGERPASSSGSKFRNGDTLLARITPCLENGKGAKVSGLPSEGVGHGSTEFIVLRAKLKSDENFVYYISRHPDFRSFAIQQMSGTSGRQRVSWQPLADFEIQNLDVQDRAAIGDTLSLLDDKIELNRRMNETLEGMTQAIFRDWFVDFGPTRRKAAGEADPVAIMGGLTPDPARAAHLAALFPAAFGNDGLPVGWLAGTLDNLAKAAGETVNPTAISSDTPYFGLEHLPRQCITLDAWGNAGSVSSNKTRFAKGQVLFGKLRPYFHKVGIAPIDGVSSTDIVVLDSKRPADRPFLASCVSTESFVAFTDQGSTGTKMPRTSWGQMKTYPVALAPEPVRDGYAAIVQPMHDKIVAAVHENRTLAETRDYLLPRLMSGAVRVAPKVEAD